MDIFVPRNSLRPDEVGVELLAAVRSFLENSVAVYGPSNMLPWQEVCIVPYTHKLNGEGDKTYLLQGIFFASTERKSDDEIQSDIMDLLRADSDNNIVTVHAPGSKFDVKMYIDTQSGGRVWIFFNHITLSVGDDTDEKTGEIHKGLRSLGNYAAVEELMGSLIKTVGNIANAHGLG